MTWEEVPAPLRWQTPSSKSFKGEQERCLTVDVEGDLGRDDYRSRVRAALPEIELVEDTAARAAVEDIWVQMWREGGHKELDQAPFSHKYPGVSLVEHVRAVVIAADRLAQVMEEVHGVDVDREALWMASLLHDVSKLVEEGTDGRLTPKGALYPHAFLAGVAAKQRLLPEKVVSLIVMHTPQVNRSSPYAVEADILDHADMASTGVLRALTAQRTGAARDLAQPEAGPQPHGA